MWNALAVVREALAPYRDLLVGSAIGSATSIVIAGVHFHLSGSPPPGGSSRLALSLGATIRSLHITPGAGQDNGTQEIGRVVPHPSIPGAAGIRNLSGSTWKVTFPDGTTADVSPGRAVPLNPKTSITIDGISCTSCRHPGNCHARYRKDCPHTSRGQAWGLSSSRPEPCEGLLRDTCPECNREIFVLTHAVRQHVTDDLLSPRHTLPLALTEAFLVKRLEDEWVFPRSGTVGGNQLGRSPWPVLTQPRRRPEQKNGLPRYRCHR